MSKMRRDLAQMKKDLQDTQVAIQKLEGQVTLLSLDRRVADAPPTQVASSAMAPTHATPERTARSQRAVSAERPASAQAAKVGPRVRTESKQGPVLPVVRLSGKAEAPPQDESWVDPGALDDGSPPIEIRVRSDDGAAKERIAVDHEVLKHPDPVLAKPSSSRDGDGSGSRGGQEFPSRRGQDTRESGEQGRASPRPEDATSPQIEAEYSQALARLRAENKPQEALSLFESFRANHPRSNLSDNALYWSAECHFQMKAYDRAIAAFEKLVQDRPRSQKIPDAMIRSGEAWIALGQPERAKPILQHVIDSYPKSDAAGRARSALESLVR
jgi:tol-pal system protein YbgF